MKTVSQVTKLTGVSPRTLQYYDEIGLLKPSGLTSSGYRLYNDEALQKLQQVLFFKELGFTLKEIQEFINQPDFDKIAAFKKQKELLLLKRNQTDRLIQLLSHLEKGENYMSFKEFDLSDYIEALECFKNNRTDDIIKYWGSVKNFDLFVQKIKNDEPEVAKLAIKQYGSIEKYTEAMKYNLEHFSEIRKQSDQLYSKLTADLSVDFSSDEIQYIVQEIIDFIRKNTTTTLEAPFLSSIIHSYSSDYVKSVTDTKYGVGASDYIVNAFQYYSNNQNSDSK